MKLLVTGGAGFIGSHLVDQLMQDGHSVVCVDDLSLGRMEHIQHHVGQPRFQFVRLNLLDREALEQLFRASSFEQVFHFAANSDIKQGATLANVDLEKTFLTTFSVLECMRVAGVQNILFPSTSAVYGERHEALHEDIGPLFPISYYGAAKLSSEAFISAFCEYCAMRAWIIRFPNVVGERSTHGAMFDFIRKLKANPRELEILGDGAQNKPYLYVKDLIAGIIFIWKSAGDRLNYFNLGVDSATTVTRIAEIVMEEMGLKDVRFRYTGGKRGWAGDVPVFRYDLAKIHRLGWKAPRTSDEAVRTAVRAELNRI